MLNKSFQSILLKIQIAKFISRLDNIKEVYCQHEHQAYLEMMQNFYSDLVRLSTLEAYAAHHDLMVRLKQGLESRNAHDIHDISQEINIFLDKLYSEIDTKNRAGSTRLGKYTLISVSVFILFLAAAFYNPLKEKYAEEKKQAYFLAHEDEFKQQTLKDILTLKQALDRYYNEHKSYPSTNGSWDGILSSYGKSKA